MRWVILGCFLSKLKRSGDWSRKLHLAPDKGKRIDTARRILTGNGLMFDTMTFTKVLGSFCGALLIFLLGQWAAELLYHTGGGYGDDYQQGYVIETGADDGAEELVEEGPSFAELYASADLGKGIQLRKTGTFFNQFF